MRRIYILAGMLSLTVANAQHHGVGINNTTPEATLDISINANAAPGSKQGLLIPRITKKDLADITSPAISTLIYVNEITAAVARATVTEVNADGFYYFYNGKWRKVSPDVAQYLSSESVKLVNNKFERAALTGDVTAAQNSNTVTINDGAVTSAKIANGTILAEDLNQMNATKGQVLKWNGTAWAPSADNAGLATEVDGVIGNEVLNATTDKGLERAGAGTTADPYTLGIKDQGVTNAMIANNAVNSAKIANNAVTTDKIANGTIKAEDLSNMGAANGQVLKWNGTAWAPSADNAGLTTEVDGVIGNEVLNATTDKGLERAGAGTTADPYTLGIKDQGVTNAMIANNAVNSAKIANNAVTTDKIANGTIKAEDLNQMNATNGQVLKWNGTAWAPAADTNTTYTAGSGIMLNGTTFIVPVSISGSGNVVTDVMQTGDGIQVTKATLPDNNTTYTAGTGLTLTGTTFSANPAGIALGGDVIGNAAANTVTKIQNKPVATTAPTKGSVLYWDGAVWTPKMFREITEADYKEIKLGRKENRKYLLSDGVLHQSTTGTTEYIGAGDILYAGTVAAATGVYYWGLTIPAEMNGRGLHVGNLRIAITDIAAATVGWKTVDVGAYTDTGVIYPNRATLVRGTCNVLGVTNQNTSYTPYNCLALINTAWAIRVE